jgi:hypothetical protein
MSDIIEAMISIFELLRALGSEEDGKTMSDSRDSLTFTV